MMGGSEISTNMMLWWAPSLNCGPPSQNDAQHRLTTHAMHPGLFACSNHMFFDKYCQHETGPFRRGTLRHRENDSPRHGPREDRDHTWPAADNEKAVAPVLRTRGRAKLG